MFLDNDDSFTLNEKLNNGEIPEFSVICIPEEVGFENTEHMINVSNDIQAIAFAKLVGIVFREDFMKIRDVFCKKTRSFIVHFYSRNEISQMFDPETRHESYFINLLENELFINSNECIYIPYLIHIEDEPFGLLFLYSK